MSELTSEPPHPLSWRAAEDRIKQLEARIKTLEARIKEAEWSRGWSSYAAEAGSSCPWCGVDVENDWDADFRDCNGRLPVVRWPHKDTCPAFTPDGVVK